MKFKNGLIKNGFTTIENYNNVYRDNSQDIKYSDGKIEFKILDTLKNLPIDKIERFKILENAIEDWPTEYHFSWTRQNILKPLQFSSNDIILELGGGTGMITDYLTENSKYVLTIEGTQIRAESIACRCSNKNNLEVIIANFLELNLLNLFGEKSFSKIILIGVLEYTPKFAPNNVISPIDKLLKDCHKLLKADGEIIIGIENKIGLKYLLGWQEDHTSKSHYGTQSLYKEKDVITFTKREIKEKLKLTNFNSIEFYYPFPDYKLPKVIVKESEHLTTPESKELISTLLENNKSRNYSGFEQPKVMEGRVLKNFIQNETLGEISNSFLIIAKKEITKKQEQKPFLYYFSTDRRFHYANEMLFSKINNEITVKKMWYGEKTKNKLLNLDKDGFIDYKFKHGTNLSTVLNNLYLLDSKEEYLFYILKWVSFLTENIEKLKPHTFDLIPSNFLIDTKGVMSIFDYEEWRPANNISIPQLLKRHFDIQFNHLTWINDNNKNQNESLSFLNNKLNIRSMSEYEICQLNDLKAFLKKEIYRKSYKTEVIFTQKRNFKKGLAKKLLPPIFIDFLKKILIKLS